jgi:hypothetical protein
MIIRTIVRAVRNLTETIRLGLCRLNEMQFEAPWAPRRSRCSGL